MGVTALAAVNGPGAYARRYRATRELLDEGHGRAASNRRKTMPKKRSRRAKPRRVYFSNPRRGRARAYTFEEWAKMTRNRRRRSTRRRRKSTRRRYRRNQTMMTAAKPAAKPAVAAANRRRRRRKTTRRRKYRRNTVMQAAANKRRRKTRKKVTRRRKYRRNTVMQAAANKRRRRRKTTRRRKYRRNTVMQAAANKRRRGRKMVRRRRRRYRRNPKSDMKKQFEQALKIGAAVTGGFLAHRALSKAAEDMLFKNSTNTYKGLMSGALVAAIGIPLSAKFAPKEAKHLATGMVVSLLHKAVVKLLEVADQPKIAGYFANYPNAEGRAYNGMGSYYSYKPHEVYQGTGEYYQTNGMGEYYQTSGMGQFEQAAAGTGQFEQAAAGTGEYYVQDAAGIGEYEEVTPEATAPFGMDEGIYPDLTSAEKALSVAEAAAGVGGLGNTDVPMISTINPTGQAVPVQDVPEGSRSGTFAGRDGIFG